jgi:hypothetical protein
MTAGSDGSDGEYSKGHGRQRSLQWNFPPAKFINLNFFWVYIYLPLWDTEILIFHILYTCRCRSPQLLIQTSPGLPNTSLSEMAYNMCTLYRQVTWLAGERPYI